MFSSKLPSSPILSWLRRRKHKNSKALFLLRGMSRLLLPGWITRKQQPHILNALDGMTRADVEERVNYYCKELPTFSVGADAAHFSQLSFQKRSAYYFDFQEVIRYFRPTNRFYYVFGDVIDVPPTPAFVKSRPIAGENRNGVLLKLNKVRHFTFVKDDVPFEQKKDMLVWRGKAGVIGRVEFVRKYFGNPLFDIGQTNPPDASGQTEWQKGYMSIADQLLYKCILSIEGFDVASNLKWIMSSNSLCFMKKPRYETWFMEGRLIPGIHYVEVRDDYGDLEEKVRYYTSHHGEALAIIRKANDYCNQFVDNKQERLISLLVMKKYFEKSGQPTI